MVGRCRDCDLTWTSFVVDSRPTSLSPTPPRTRPKPPWMESWAFRPVATCTALERFCGPGAWPGRPGPKHPPQSGERQSSRQLRVNEVSPSAPSHHHGCCPTGGQDEVQLGSRPSGIHPSGVVSSVSKQLNHRSNAQKIDGWESSVHPSAIRRLFPLLDNVDLVPLPWALLRIQSEAVCSPFLLCPWSRFLPCHQIPQPLTAQIFHALRTAPLSGTTGASWCCGARGGSTATDARQPTGAALWHGETAKRRARPERGGGGDGGVQSSQQDSLFSTSFAL